MKHYLSLILLITAFISCDSNRVFEENVEIEQGVWNINNPIHFEVQNLDTISEYNVIINVRHATHYPFSNLWMFVKTTAPDKSVRQDTVECFITSKDGKRLGKGLGDLWDVQVPLKSTKLDQLGVYSFDVEQAMRYGDRASIENLPGILDLGLRIERNTNE